MKLDIIAAGATGYGELLFTKAFNLECHVVETVGPCPGRGRNTSPTPLYPGYRGQDMKAIWLDNGIITTIVVNEACSSGCGSFLENFASSLHIPVREIADAAFSSKNAGGAGQPVHGFYEQQHHHGTERNGKQPADIMAGLCRSIIENVFTKVIRMENVKSPR